MNVTPSAPGGAAAASRSNAASDATPRSRAAQRTAPPASQPGFSTK